MSDSEQEFSQESKNLDDLDDQDVFDSSISDAGVIQKIELINFMCHAHLEFELSPNVNFLVGSNGSGKSAVLVALVTCLGASARFTNRSSRVGDLVKNGCRTAIIKIKLRNEGPEAFKPEIYGKSITIERKIHKEGSSNYYIRDEHGKTKATTRDELEAITEQFNIQVDNPCNILMQDASKMFLYSNKSEKKYELFLKATQLEQMKEELTVAQQNVRLGEATLETKEQALPIMADRIKSLEVEVRALRELDSQRVKVKEMQVRLVWTLVAQIEQELQAQNQLIEKYSTQTEQVLVKKQEYNQKLSSTDQIKAKESEIRQLNMRSTELSQTIRGLADEIRALKAKASSFDGDINHQNDLIKRLTERKKGIESEIRKEKNKGRVDHAEEYRRALEQAEQKKEQIKELEERLRVGNQRRQELDAELVTADEKARQAQHAFKQAEIEAMKRKELVDRLSASQKDRSAAFGPHTSKIRDLVNRNKHLFSSVPLGPIGLHVTLMDEKWAQAVEHQCGKFFDYWVLNDTKDVKKFSELIAKNKLSTPPAVVSPHTKTPYKIESHNLPHPQFKKLLDVLKFDDATCQNVIIDIVNPESKILLPNLDEAKKVMFPRPPEKVTMAITLDSMILQVLGGTQVTKGFKHKPAKLTADIGQALDQAREAHHSVIAELQSYQKAAQASKGHLLDLQKTFTKHVQSLQTLPSQIETLRNEIEELEQPPPEAPDQDDAVRELEVNAAALQSKIEEAMEERTRIEEKKAEFLQQAEPTEAKKNQANEEMQTLVASVEEHVKELDTMEKDYQRAASLVAKCDAAIASLNEKRIIAEGEVTRLARKIEEDSIKAQIIGPRPDGGLDGDPEALRAKIARTEKLIEDQRNRQKLDFRVLEEYESAIATYDELRTAIDDLRASLKQAHSMVRSRGHKWIEFRRSIAGRANSFFIVYLSKKNFAGRLNFDHDAGTLQIEVNPQKSAVGGPRDTTSLSGGERSYSTVSLLLALWDTMESPFRAMDEFDVFMDAVNRRLSMEQLLKAAEEKPNRQHIFLTPHDLVGVQNKSNIKIFKMHAPERNQRTINDMIGAGEASDSE